MTKHNVYSFTHGHNDDTDLKALLGGKGTNLNIMTQTLGMPVPQGFTIPCHETFKHDNRTTLLPKLMKEVNLSIKNMESESGRTFGGENPLLLSVRSGAPVSMPGQMETILNLGLNSETVELLSSETNEDFAWDSYRRFVQMYSTIVLGADPHWYQQRVKTVSNFFMSRIIPADASRILVDLFLSHEPVPSEVYAQLEQAILAVFHSWGSEKAVAYREIENIPSDMGTAVNVQRMVFGNMNDNSGTGVAFTRNPNTGENVHYGDFLVHAQGEDVVDGSTNTLPLSDMGNHFPAQYKQLLDIMAALEQHYGDMCDIEFTIEDGNLFMLQTRIGKRSSLAETRIVGDLYNEGRITIEKMQERLAVAAEKAAGKVDIEFDGKVVATGLGAAGGLVVGKAYFSRASLIEAAATEDGPLILVSTETTPEDTAAMAKSTGILTMNGGLVSHAAVVARGWDKTAVVGLGENHHLGHKYIRFASGERVNQGELLGLNGENGEVLISETIKGASFPQSRKGKTKQGALIKSAVTLCVGDMVVAPDGVPIFSKYKSRKHSEITLSGHGPEYYEEYFADRHKTTELKSGDYEFKVAYILSMYRVVLTSKGYNSYWFLVNLRENNMVMGEPNANEI